jgi:hypothetical protein
MNETKETDQKVTLNSKEQTDSHIVIIDRPLKLTPNYEVECSFLTNKQTN